MEKINIYFFSARAQAHLRAKFTFIDSAYLTTQWPVLSFATGHIFLQTFLALSLWMLSWKGSVHWNGRKWALEAMVWFPLWLITILVSVKHLISFKAGLQGFSRQEPEEWDGEWNKRSRQAFWWWSFNTTLNGKENNCVLWFWQALLSRYLHMYLLLGGTYPVLHKPPKVNNWEIWTSS